MNSFLKAGNLLFSILPIGWKFVILLNKSRGWISSMYTRCQRPEGWKFVTLREIMFKTLVVELIMSDNEVDCLVDESVDEADIHSAVVFILQFCGRKLEIMFI